jgi:hypothetical protein
MFQATLNSLAGLDASVLVAITKKLEALATNSKPIVQAKIWSAYLGELENEMKSRDGEGAR